MKKLFTKCCLLAIAMVMGGAISANAADELIFTEDFSDETYNVTWGGTSAGGVSPAVTDGALTVANGSQSGDRSAYVSFGENAYEGSAHLTFEMKMWKSGWSGKNNTFYVYPTEEKNRYPSRTDAVVTISQDANGAISVNGNALGTYDGTNLTYDIYLDAKNKAVKVVVLNGATKINTFNLASTAAGIGAFHLTFNKNYGSFAIDNISLTTWTPTAPSHSYTVNAVVNATVLKELATGVATENAAYEVSGLPYVISVDGVCYKLNDAEVTGYKKSFTMGTADETKTVSYSVASDINYFFEAESILSRSYGNSNGAYSGGTTAAVYSGAALTMSSIAAGIYTVTVNSSVRRTNEDILTVQTSTDGTNWVNAGTISLTSNVGGNYSALEIALPVNGSIRLVESKSQNMCHYVDYVTLTKTGDVYTKTLGTTGFGTFAAACNVTVPEGVTVYTSIFADETITATADETIKVIPANTGVIFKAAAGANVTFVATAEEGSAIETALTAAVNGVDGDGATIFGLLKNKNEFAKVMSGVTLANNSAFLSISASGKGAINFVVDEDNTTTVAGVAEAKAEAKVVKFVKGGQILIKTANGIINAAAAQVK